MSVLGLATQVNIANSEGANDSLVIHGLGGDDEYSDHAALGVIELTLDGGAGDDTLLGSQGADMLLGGDDNDFVFGDNGNDVAQLGAGDDVFQWNPGDGSDTIEGGDGFDTTLFFGANIDENITITANGGHASFPQHRHRHDGPGRRRSDRVPGAGRHRQHRDRRSLRHR